MASSRFWKLFSAIAWPFRWNWDLSQEPLQNLSSSFLNVSTVLPHCILCCNPDGWSSVTHPPLPFHSLSFSPVCFSFCNSLNLFMSYSNSPIHTLHDLSLSFSLSLTFSHCASVSIHDSIKYWKHLPTNLYRKYTTSYRKRYLMILSWNLLQCVFVFSFSENFLHVF